MSSVLILKTGRTFPELAAKFGDFEEWIIRTSEFPADLFFVLDVQQNDPFQFKGDIKALIITGSHSMITENAPWMEQTVRFVKNAAEKSIPQLGICFGHHLLARAFGGQVKDLPGGPEYGAVKVNLTETGKEDPLFNSMPAEFFAFMSHQQSVLKLPPQALKLAFTYMDSNAAFFLQPNIWGVQFHPEFTMEVMRFYLQFYFKVPTEKLPNRLKPCQQSKALIKRFLHLALNGI